MFESYLECARLVNKLMEVWDDACAKRNKSLDMVYSKWIGGKRDLVFKRDNGERKDADFASSGQLWYVRDWCVDVWIATVDGRNELVHENAVRSLNEDLDVYYALEIEKARRESNALDWNVIERLENTAKYYLDNADVPKPDKVRDRDLVPSAPNYVAGSVFVRYERRSADPRDGVDVVYTTNP